MVSYLLHLGRIHRVQAQNNSVARIVSSIRNHFHRIRLFGGTAFTATRIKYTPACCFQSYSLPSIVMAQTLFQPLRAQQRTTATLAEFETELPDQNRINSHETPQSQSLSKYIPDGSWDSHMHVVDPIRYPLAENAKYNPSIFTTHEAQQFEQSIGISNIVLVQPSIYGLDNTCLLAALRELGPSRARGVVVCDPSSTSLDTLKEWHSAGVRGVRVNLQSVGEAPDVEVFSRKLQQYADMIRPFDWVLDMYVPMAMVKHIEGIASSLNVKMCLDHFASPALPHTQSLSTHLPTPPDPYNVEGFASLIRLLKTGRTWVKISGPYRLAKNHPQLAMLKAIGGELLRSSPDQLVWSSDWPHTRFEGLDIRPFLSDCIDWCNGDPGLINKLFRDNAIELWK